MQAVSKTRQPPALLTINCSHSQVPPYQARDQGCSLPSPAVSPQRPIITHPLQSTSREKRPRYHDSLFLAYKCSKRSSQFQAKHTTSDVGEMVSSMLPIPPRSRNRIGFGFDSRTSHEYVYFCPFLFFSPPFLSTLNPLLAVGHCSQNTPLSALK